MLGLLNPGIVYTLSLMGLSRVSASVTTLLWTSEPLMILLLAAALLREPLTWRLFALMAVGVVGVVLVADLAHGFPGAGAEPIGVLLVLAGVCCCALYTVLTRGLSGRADPLSLVAIQQTAGLAWTAALLSAGTRYGDWTDLTNIAPAQLAPAALSGLIYYAAAYWLFLTALRFVPAGVAGAYFNAIPVFGIGLAMVFLGETLTAVQWAGVAAIMLSVTGLARLTRHTNSLALPLFFGGVVHQILGDREGVEARCGELAQIAVDSGFHFWQAGATVLAGWALAEAGDLEAGQREIQRGMDEWRATGAEYLMPYFLALLAQVEQTAKRPQTALPMLEEAHIRVERTGERWYEAEIYRLEGEVLVALDRLADARACFTRGLETAAGQQARFWELRAALSLWRLDHDPAARDRVVRLKAGFSEGFELTDLKAARLLAPHETLQ